MEKEFYDYVCAYFENPQLDRVSQTLDFVIYATRFPSHLFQEYKYLFVYLPHIYTHPTYHLSEVEWDMLETVILQKYVKCVESSYNPDKLFPRITLQNGSKEGKVSTFFCRFPFKVLLDNPVENVSPYSDRGNLVSALEVFHTRVLRL
jgi:hypothetical protein